jgi:ribosomal protein S18 acetylase RimI-like enzyme
MAKKKKQSSSEIKLLLKKNLRSIVEIEKRNCTTEDPDFGEMISKKAWNSSDFVNFIKKKNTYTYTISEGPIIVGFLLFEVKENELLIERICIDIDFRKSGFGKELLDFIYNKKYANKITFYCKEDDVCSIQFFKKNNFVANLEKNHFGVDDDGIRFTKEIFHEENKK